MATRAPAIGALAWSVSVAVNGTGNPALPEAGAVNVRVVGVERGSADRAGRAHQSGE